MALSARGGGVGGGGRLEPRSEQVFLPNITGWSLSLKSGTVRGKSGNFYRLSELKSSSTHQDQLCDLSFLHNSISKSQGNFSEVREKSEKTMVEKKWQPCIMLIHARQ